MKWDVFRKVEKVGQWTKMDVFRKVEKVGQWMKNGCI
jgi:hypothetical protein